MGGVVPFVGGAGLPKIFMAKEEPISSDDELDSIIVPMSEETPLDLAECKRGPGYVGAYSPEERRERIARFHEKRLRRVWKKRVTYSTRKNIANKRMRVKGRFIKKEEAGLMTGALDAPCGEMLSSATASDVDDDVCNSSGAGGLSEDDDTPLSDALGCMLGDDAFS